MVHGLGFAFLLKLFKMPHFTSITCRIYGYYCTILRPEQHLYGKLISMLKGDLSR